MNVYKVTIRLHQDTKDFYFRSIADRDWFFGKVDKWRDNRKVIEYDVVYDDTPLDWRICCGDAGNMLFGLLKEVTFKKFKDYVTTGE